jgi:hypothetical protein
MNTSNIDALATAPEVRANEAKVDVKLGFMKAGFNLLSEDSRAATATPSPTGDAVPLPPLPLPPVAGTAPRLQDTAAGGSRRARSHGTDFSVLQVEEPKKTGKDRKGPQRTAKDRKDR